MRERVSKPASGSRPIQRAAAQGAAPVPAAPAPACAAASVPRVQFDRLAVQPSGATRPQPNRTGLPDRLKSGIEALSGVSMDRVAVRYNSSRPHELGAHAYAQGREIHLAPGQERHLPHEAWHLVQQAKGRVRPTMQLRGGTAINDSAALEREADIMGAKALRMTAAASGEAESMRVDPGAPAAVVQRQPIEDLFDEEPELAKHILSYLPAGDLASARSVSEAFKARADETPVEGVQFKGGETINMGELTQHMAGFTPTGLHGASSKDAESLYGGVTINHKSNYDGAKLGPGFYMTEGSEPIEQRVAKHFADNRVSKSGGNAEVYRVLTRNLSQMRSSKVAPGPWMKTEPPSKELRPDSRGAGDIMKSDLTDLQKFGEARPPRELKVAPHLISPTLDDGVFPQHKPLLDKDGGALRTELEQKRQSFGLEVLPPIHVDEKSRERSVVLGEKYLNALHSRIKKK